MDDLLFENVEELKEKENIVNDPEEVIDIEESINEFKREEIELNEGKQDNFTDASILGSNATNNLLGTKSINVDNFNITILWENTNSLNSFNEQTIELSDSIDNYDLIRIYWKSNSGYNYELDVCVSPDNIGNALTTYIGLNSYNFIDVRPNYSSRYLKGGITRNKIEFSSNYYVNTSRSDNTKNIPLKIEGLKYKTVIEPEPTPTPEEPTTSGNGIVNNITNNYYCTVSDDSLSYNMLNKPLNKYTTGESYIVFGTLMFLGIGLYLIIRRSIFKWH